MGHNFRAAVPFLGGLVTVFSGSSSLLFNYYRLVNGTWELQDKCVHPTSYSEVVQLGLYHVDGCVSSRIPCALCRHHQDANCYCIVQYEPGLRAEERTATRRNSANGLMIMISGDVTADVDCGREQEQFWQFDWSKVQSRCTLLIIKTSNALAYVVLTFKGGVANRVDVPSAVNYIPPEYDSIVKSVGIHWRVEFDGCGLVYKPLFIVGTSCQQLLIFENGSTLLCIQLKGVPLDTISWEVSKSVFMVGVVLHGSSILIYQVSDAASSDSIIYRLKGTLLKTITDQRPILSTVAGDFTGQGGGDQLLLIMQGDDYGPDKLEFQLCSSFTEDKLTTQLCLSTPGDTGTMLPPQSLIGAAKALGIRKLSGDVLVDQRKRILMKKAQLVSEGMAIISQQDSKTQSNQPLISLYEPTTDDCNRGLPLPNASRGMNKQPIRLLEYWRRIVDGMYWAVGLLIANNGPINLTDVQLFLVPKGEGPVGGACCKMVSLTVPDSALSQDELLTTIKTNVLPANSTGCFVITVDLQCMPSTAAVMATYLLGDQSNYSCQRLWGICNDTSLNATKKCTPLQKLSDLWTGEEIIQMVDDPTERLMDLACHFGSKQLSKIKVKVPSGNDALAAVHRNLMEVLPFPMIRPTTPTTQSSTGDWLLPGVCLACCITCNDVITFSIVHRSAEELSAVERCIKNNIPVNYCII